MEKKQKYVIELKAVIDKLRDGRQTWSDFKQPKFQNKEIPDKTLERYLNALNYWGLARLDHHA